MGDGANDRREALLKAVVVVLAIAVPLVTFYLAFVGTASRMCFGPPCTPDPAADDFLTAAFIVGTLGSVVGIALSFRTRQVVPAVVLGFVLALTLFFKVAELVSDARNSPPEPIPSRPKVCQEHSGGDNRCPGG